MGLMYKTIRTTMLGVLFCAAFSSGALAVDREVYDTPDVQPGKTKVMHVDVDEKATQTWHVSVKDSETGRVVLLHVDKTTTRKDMMLSPDIGDNVTAKYNERNHAISFLTDQTINR